jgi:hypothetical protein
MTKTLRSKKMQAVFYFLGVMVVLGLGMWAILAVASRRRK